MCNNISLFLKLQNMTIKNMIIKKSNTCTFDLFSSSIKTGILAATIYL